MAHKDFTIYVNDKQTVSEPLMWLLGFFDYDSSWIRDENSPALVNELVHALTDIGYKWVVEIDYGTQGIRHYDTIEEWSEWYDN